METKKMRKSGVLVGIVLLVMTLNGCSKPPQASIDEAKGALESARSGEAGTYAQASLRSAEDSLSALDAELKAQEDKFALFRSYKHADELAATAKAAGEKALADAKAGKEQKKAEAQAAINDAKASLDAANATLATAPTGKGTQADLATMKADLEGVASAITEAEGMMASEKYMDAKAKADAAKQTTQGVTTAVEEAKAAKMAGGKGGKK